MKLSGTQIRSLIEKKEDERVEFKRASSELPDNIFALVDIGERSGMGLANLHGLWKKYGYTEPKITESYDPDRTVLVVTTDDDTVNYTVTRPENGSEPDQNPTRSAPKVPQKCPQSAPTVPQKVTIKLRVTIKRILTLSVQQIRTTPGQHPYNRPGQHPYNTRTTRRNPVQYPDKSRTKLIFRNCRMCHRLHNVCLGL